MTITNSCPLQIEGMCQDGEPNIIAKKEEKWEEIERDSKMD